MEESLVGGLQTLVGMPQNFAGEILIYTLAGALVIVMTAVILNAMFRRWF